MVRSATLSVKSWACHRVILGCAGNHGDPVDDMCEHRFDEIISNCLETDGLDHLQWLAMPDNLIFMGLHFVIGKCTQHPTNFIAVWVPPSDLFLRAIAAHGNTSLLRPGAGTGFATRAWVHH
jgi:hypothetical protein